MDRENKKVCTNCEQEKRLVHFYKDKTTADGHKAQCKMCFSRSNSVSYHKNKNSIPGNNPIRSIKYDEKSVSRGMATVPYSYEDKCWYAIGGKKIKTEGQAVEYAERLNAYMMGLIIYRNAA